jgi:hypothetical protein
VPFFLLVTAIPFANFYERIFQDYGELTIVKKRKIYKIFGISRSNFLKSPWYACILATIYLSLRETMQLFFISDSMKNYIKRRSNQFEIIIIVLSIIILYGMKALTLQQIKNYMAIPSAFVIIFGKQFTR